MRISDWSSDVCSSDLGKPGQKKHVGLFYSLWLGQHHSGQRAIYDIQHLLNTNPEALNNPHGTPESPMHEFHFWGEPLYGYYSMSDPWVVTRHIELLTNARSEERLVGKDSVRTDTSRRQPAH